MKAKKWNFKEEKYFDYKLPKGCRIFTKDLDEFVTCASCGTKVVFGNTYTSKQIHNNSGFGYPVCPECYQKELKIEKLYED